MDTEFETWLTTQVMTNASLADIACAKRLLFEAQTLALTTLQDQAHAPEQTTIKKIPTAERETKMKELKKKLSGILI